MKRIRIEKVGEVKGGLPANPTDAHNPGEDQGEQFSLPIDYWIEGVLVGDIQVGKPVFVQREIRNGVDALGEFMSTPVTELTDTQFKTRNSVYNYRYV